MPQPIDCFCRKSLPNRGAFLWHASKCETVSKTALKFFKSANDCIDDVIYAEDYNEELEDVATGLAKYGLHLFQTMNIFLHENGSEPVMVEPDTQRSSKQTSSRVSQSARDNDSYMNIINRMLNKNKDRQKRYLNEISGLKLAIKDKKELLLKLNADPETTGFYHQKIKKLEDEIQRNLVRIQEMEALRVDADSEHQDVTNELSIIQKEVNLHEMSFGNEILDFQKEFDKEQESRTKQEQEEKVVALNQPKREDRNKKEERKAVSKPKVEQDPVLSDRITLTRLPQLPDKRNWGQNFQWPTSDWLKRLDDQSQVVKIKAIEIWSNSSNYMSGVRITLSNGEQSPHFQSSSSQNGPAVLELRQDLSPRKIEIATGPYTCEAIRISDCEEQELCNWVGREGKPYKEQSVPEGQQIVGIYGSSARCILNFGFLIAKIN